jgi:DNA-binding NarL/FixJ family response regulator
VARELRRTRLPASSIRVLVAEDHPDFRRYLISRMQNRAGFHVVCEVADGSEAVQKAQTLRPDLVLLDIGMPGLNGIEAAKKIRSLSPNSKILFISENHASDIVEEALCTGALGYVVKSDAASDLFPAVEAILQGKEFVSNRVAVDLVNCRTHKPTV